MEDEKQELAAIQLLWKVMAHVKEMPMAFFMELEPDEFQLIKTMVGELNATEDDPEDEDG